MTRDEWMEKRAALIDLGYSPTGAQHIMEVVVGPCPPEPPPVWKMGAHIVVVKDCLVKIEGSRLITPAYARRMAAAILDAADWIERNNP